ncbi:MAG: lipopolysaccharide heptosyltransferase II [Desulfuromonas sp.]|uniref:lipopolysaccharide heptosyltransferase II n=1 Tax=Desulfuromonas sp. TaxID=892 RepID=UPI000CC04410|nr:lipopolysaccharide heptosyltransferase II [Desulfuromonas sp.]PLX84690.1 MAG: lipopolysaccharide heptosyltransferase II [Desulfuromonas sp.]
MKKILIIRPSAIGDVVMASPMIKVLRCAYPGARIAWLAEPQVKDLLASNPDLDQVFLWPKGHWRQLLRRGRLLALAREVSVLARQLRREEFDLAIDAMGLLKSRVLAWLSGARQRVGFDSREPGRSLMTRIVARGSGDKRMSSEYIRMMEDLGLSPGGFEPHIAVSPEDEESALEKLRGAGVEFPFAAFAPFTTRPQKHWLDERWAGVARGVRDKFGMQAVMLGGPGDVERGARIAACEEGTLVDLVGSMTLGQTAAVLKNCSLLIGVDTGLTHMGAAFDRPTVALFGSTCPYLRTPRDKFRVLYSPMDCSPCRRRPTCEDGFLCMEALGQEDVLRAAQEVVA